MRFSDLFIDYKIGLKGIKSTIKFTKLPLYRKVFLFIFSTVVISIGILFIFNQNTCSFILMVLSLLLLIIFNIIDSREENLIVMLENNYIPYSKKRMKMTINVLKKYNINFKDLESLDMLIAEAKNAQAEYDIFSKFKKPLKKLSAIIIAIVIYVAKKASEKLTLFQLLKLAPLAIILILIVFLTIFCFITIFKDLFYCNYNKYNELIYDIRQIKLFYAKKQKKN